MDRNAEIDDGNTAEENPAENDATVGAIDWTRLATASGFQRIRRVFWGLLLAFLSFRLTVNGLGIDIIPDWVGWLLVATALKGLQGVHERIPRLLVLAWIGFAVGLAEWVSSDEETVISAFLLTAWVVPLAATIAVVLFCWDFCAMIVRAAEDTQDARLRERADLCRRVVLVALLVAWLLPLPVHFGETLHPATVIAVLALGFFAWIYFLAMVWAFGTLVRRVIAAVEAQQAIESRSS